MFYINYLIIFISFMKVLSALESSDGLKRGKSVEWSDCGANNATVRWEDFQLSDPIRMEKLALGARYRILEEVQTGSYSKVEVWRVLNLFILPVYVKIPCIGKFGSCNYNICRVWDRDNFCNFQRVNNASCGCPMKVGVVEGYDFKARIPEKKITTYQSMFARGLYMLRWTWYNPRGEAIGCLEGQGNLDLRPNSF